MSRLAVLLERSLFQVKLKSQFPCVCKGSPVQFVRCYRPRKPFWLPMAKSKMFRIPKVPEIPEEELIEITRLYNVYRTNMKSVRQFFKEQLMAQTTAPEVIAERKKREVDQHESCIKLNDVWNAETAKYREQRLVQEATNREENILHKIMEQEKKQETWVKQLDSHVRSEKEAAKTFITPDNIDKAIEIALVNIVDNNFCIDKSGNMFMGRYGKPTTDKKPVALPQPATAQEENLSLEVKN